MVASHSAHNNHLFFLFFLLMALDFLKLLVSISRASIFVFNQWTPNETAVHYWLTSVILFGSNGAKIHLSISSVDKFALSKHITARVHCFMLILLWQFYINKGKHVTVCEKPAFDKLKKFFIISESPFQHIPALSLLKTRNVFSELIAINCIHIYWITNTCSVDGEQYDGGTSAFLGNKQIGQQNNDNWGINRNSYIILTSNNLKSSSVS